MPSDCLGPDPVTKTSCRVVSVAHSVALMLERPPNLTDEQIADGLRDDWHLEPTEVSYADAGRGSFNWTALDTDGHRWFIKVNPKTQEPEFFDRTYKTAAELREAGLEFVHAAIRTPTGGELRRPVAGGYLMSVFAYIDGRNRAARYEDDDEPMVMTHGEPHTGNTMVTAGGEVRLIDCDAMMAGPRERDLRLLLDASHDGPLGLDNTAVLAAYRHGTGRAVEPRRYVMDMLRAEWHLGEIGAYLANLSQPHGVDRDTVADWRAFTGYVPVEQNWPELTYK